MPRLALAAAILAAASACGAAAAQQQYLYVWATGVDGQGDGSDKLVTVDATRASDRYGKVVHTLSVGGRGELGSLRLSDDGRSLRAARASDGRVFEFDVGSDPSRPRMRRASAGAGAGEAPREARDDARGTWVESHYRWQIRTFWFALLWFVIAWILIVTILGAVIGVPFLVVLTLWLVYRIVRGWLRLNDRRPMYV